MMLGEIEKIAEEIGKWLLIIGALNESVEKPKGGVNG
jgi:hypothetical protein